MASKQKKPCTLTHLVRGVKGALDINRIPQLTECSGYAVDVGWLYLAKYVWTALTKYKLERVRGLLAKEEKA